MRNNKQSILGRSVRLVAADPKLTAKKPQILVERYKEKMRWRENTELKCNDGINPHQVKNRKRKGCLLVQA